MKKLEIEFNIVGVEGHEQILTMQVLEQEGLPDTYESKHVIIDECAEISTEVICIRGKATSYNWNIDFLRTDNPREQIQSYIKWITKELFVYRPGEDWEPRLYEEIEAYSYGKGWQNARFLCKIPPLLDGTVISYPYKVERYAYGRGITSCYKIRPLPRRAKLFATWNEDNTKCNLKWEME